MELSKVLYNCCCERSMVYDLFVGCDKEWWYSWHFLDMVKIVSDDCEASKICEEQEKFHY